MANSVEEPSGADSPPGALSSLDNNGEQLQLILIHNEKAGSGEYSRSTIGKLLEEAGHRVCAFSPQRDKLKKALKQPADLIVIAGGDGAVTKVIDHAKAKGPPLTILPLGTANNIATSLGITGEPAALIETWDPLKIRSFYRLYAKGPWGRRRIIEGIGFGCFEQTMDEMGTLKPDIERARQWLADAILRTPPERLTVEFDSAALMEEFTLLEMTNIPLVGPRIHLAPFANPSDPLVMVSFVGARRADRLELSRWLKRAAPNEAAPVTTRAARRVVIEGEIRRVRLNDKNWTAKTEISENSFDSVVIEAGVKPLHFLVPRLEALTAPRAEAIFTASYAGGRAKRASRQALSYVISKGPTLDPTKSQPLAIITPAEITPSDVHADEVERIRL